MWMKATDNYQIGSSGVAFTPCGLGSVVE